MIPVLRAVRKQDKNAQFRGSKISTRGRLFGESNLSELGINLHETCTTTKNQVTNFAGKHSLFSNLHPVAPNEEGVRLQVDNEDHGSMEHYYVTEKCITAKDFATAAKVRGCTDPVEAMALGKSVKTDGTNWDQRKVDVMRKGLIAKFNIPMYREALKKTTGELHEGTKHPFWGYGYTSADNRAFSRGPGRSENRLGKLLMEIREFL